ncbi:DUF1343 domain-containing protein [Humibacter antri]
MEQVRTGAQRMLEDPRALGRGPIGLLTNFTGTLPDLRRTADALVAAGAPITTLFSPEHGLHGSAQAGEAEHAVRDEGTGLPVFDTYLKQGADLDELLRASAIETLVFDMQDIGVRYYTYVWSLYDALFSAARVGIGFVVLDRPNPLGGAIAEGSGLDATRFGSFVGRADIPLRHGLTAGELARLFVSRELRAAGLTVDLTVVELEGWDAVCDFDSTGLAWVPPSPNMPTLDTAYAFAGLGLIEGTNVSEGRGTTRPFETMGAPFVDARLAASLREAELPGVLFREVWFMPTFSKYIGETIRGVQLHVVDRRAFRPVTTGLAVIDALARLHPDEFRFLAPDERLDGPDPRPGIDLLWGSDSLRRTVQNGGSAVELSRTPEAIAETYDSDVLLYPR